MIREFHKEEKVKRKKFKILENLFWNSLLINTQYTEECEKLLMGKMRFINSNIAKLKITPMWEKSSCKSDQSF